MRGMKPQKQLRYCSGWNNPTSKFDCGSVTDHNNGNVLQNPDKPRGAAEPLQVAEFCISWSANASVRAAE